MEPTELSPENLLIDAIMGKIDKDIDLTLSAPVNASGKKLDGQYRTIKLVGNESFSLIGLREGKRSSFIFEFEPVDARDFKTIEFGDDVAFQTFPELLPAVLKAIDGKDGDTFKVASANFRTRIRKERAKAAKEAEKIEKAATENHYAKDDLWGAF